MANILNADDLKQLAGAPKNEIAKGLRQGADTVGSINSILTNLNTFMDKAREFKNLQQKGGQEQAKVQKAVASQINEHQPKLIIDETKLIADFKSLIKAIPEAQDNFTLKDLKEKIDILTPTIKPAFVQLVKSSVRIE